jgi:virginiamycin B lyase
MRRALLLTLAMLVVAPAAAEAVTFQQFPMPAGSRPFYLKPGPDGNLWIVDQNAAAPAIARMSPQGTALQAISLSSDIPNDLTVAPSGEVHWVSSNGAAGLWGRRTTGGAVITEPVLAGVATGIAVGPSGRVTVGGVRAGDSGSVLCSVAAGVLPSCTPLPGFLGPVSSLVYRADGLLTALVPLQDAMVALPDTFTTPGEIATGSLPGGPTRSALGPDGEMWFTQTADGTILNGGTGQPIALPRPGTQPWDITAGPDGALWFTESQGNAIGRVSTSGQVTEFPLPAGSGRPFGITTGPDGNIWFTTRSPAAVVRMSFDPVTPGRGGGGGGGGAGVVADRTAPRVSPGLRLSGFRQGRGSTFTFTLSEPARVAIKVEKRAGTGRRVGGRCVARTRGNRSRPRCTRYSSVGTVRADGRQGVNELRFSGRLNGRNLSPGTYRASLTATDAAGNASSVSRATFTVRRR